MTQVPTPEQQAVLDNTVAARIRVVRAAPGSGKTWLVAELIRRQLVTPGGSESGIAALSFTRVGGDEIRHAVGHDLSHPHFVGTIDAFLFRYVVRPFLRACYPNLAAPRLLPAEDGPARWSKRGQLSIPNERVPVNIFQCVFLDEDPQSQKPIIGSPPYGAGPLSRLDGGGSDAVVKEKVKAWKNTGQLTHSDAAFLASRVLRHKGLGPKIRSELVRRFRLFVIDELQDTGFYLGDCIHALLGEPDARGVLVGDPDQAIYEFTGARPELFEKFTELQGAHEFPLQTTRRCCAGVTAAAKHLKVTDGDFRPADDASGAAFLLTYSDMIADIERLHSHLVARGTPGISVVSRANDTVNQLQRRSAKEGAQTLQSPSLKHMHQAVIYLRQGKNAAAIGSSRAALERALFDAEGLTEEELSAKGIGAEQARILTASAVVAAAQLDTDCTLLQWQGRIATSLLSLLREAALVPTGGSVEKRLRPQAKRKNNHGSPASAFLPDAGQKPLLSAQTVHAVKGETHDATIFVCRGPSRGVACPSSEWWPQDDKEQEERRIAYVAMTRTKGDLFVTVSFKCRDNLSAKKPEFVAAFKCMTIDEFIAQDNALSAAAVTTERR